MARGRTSLALSPRVLGIAFLALCVLFVYATYAVFTKKFVDYDEVTLRANKIGLSLPARADVKIRGVLVGEVLDVRTDGDQAELTLGLYPEERDTIPANVTGSILPKTLFGEKFVSLDVPPQPEPQPIRPGATIKRTDVAIEVEEVLNDLYPFIRTVRPADLNVTLTAIANALEGRGETIGASLETLDAYLRRFNPEVPALVADLIKLGQVSQTYESVVPELARLLRNTVKTTQTFESREDQVQQLFNDVAGFSGTARQFLRANGDTMIRLAGQGAQILPVLEKYAPQFPCFLRGMVASIPRNEEAFRDKTLHIILETLPRQPRGYNVADQPENNDKRGPFRYCNLLDKAIAGGFGQENLPPQRVTSPQIQDGVNYPLAKRAAVTLPGDAVAGTAAEQQVLGLAAAPVLGVPVDQVPDLTTLLLGPMARGMEVNVR